MWARFLALCSRQGIPIPDTSPCPESRAAALLQASVEGRMPAGWFFLNALEAADLDSAFSPSPPAEACPVRPGSPAKLRYLAERVEQGHDLWKDDDYTCDC